MSAPRNRFPDSAANRKTSDSSNGATSGTPKSLHSSGLSEKFWLAVIAFCILLFVVVDKNFHAFPLPLKNVKSTNQSISASGHVTPSSFVEENAREFLEFLCEFGTRHLGSHANEVISVEVITARIRAIQQTSKSLHKVEMDVQTPTGCFDLDFIGQFTSCYTNIKNILVRLSPATADSASSLLVNCHYDSAISSPGRR